ncbi:aldehyde dehydrogenase family protein [Craterilacuibacter sinensis]|uniref:Aldehyde dehydrogenase family protein n=1 Tax=Craterilacuibacter sinensis TaxID=2686017 RepID=A0A845BKY2_9NEIS|nr:aldehyde dehydrogenase family protein [Craterilacuibacter sinensis]MXR36995.1 aldehyde dehydrogenase family protein [Craterilacuibacter sinensis]
MKTHFDVISPIDGKVLLTRDYASAAQIRQALVSARAARRAWACLPLEERLALLGRAVDALVADKARIADSITRQIGRPIAHSPFEVRGLAERARHMLAIAREALADIRPEPVSGLIHFMRREALGTVLILAPWNYPFLTALNSLIPALAAGNTVLLKHSSQTPLAAEILADAFAAAGLPEGAFQYLHLDHASTLALVADAGVDFVAFTGSVEGGRAIERAAAGRFIGTGLELGGKDAAYVRADADLDAAVENLVDGAFFNAGQSCCGIERIYVEAALYPRFVDGFVAQSLQYRLGNPLETETTLGPMVRASAAEFVREQIREAVAQGARALIDPALFSADAPGSAYLAPQVLVDVNHSMRVMHEESFGPVVGIMPVADDAEALQLMNDSRYGLTASLWTRDEDAAIRLGTQLETGTVFMNRCDYLDPALAWTGVKDSGRGISLSCLGYAQLTRIKSFHLKG